MYDRKFQNQNLDIYKALEGYKLRPSLSLPGKLLGFNKAKTSRASKSTFIHFYLDDYQFERIWSNPASYINLFKSYGGIIGPDFSQYLDMPDEMKRWNDYRNKLLMKYYQSNGVDVIPSVSWSDADSLQYALDGIPKQSVISISFVGCMKNKTSNMLLSYGLKLIESLLDPVTILIYGETSEKICLEHRTIVYPTYSQIRRGDI